MVMQGKKNAVVVIVMVLCIYGCKNPFFPSTGEPVEGLRSEPRATSQGLLDQLIESYETRRIELFVDLLPKDGSFRFFISPSYYSDYSSRYQQLREPRDNRLQFLEEYDYYYYWPQQNEIDNHEKLFSQAYSIEFKSKPAIESVNKFYDNGDSLVELKVTGGKLEIGKDMGDIIELYSTTIDKQVLLIRKESDGLWVMVKWYDFSISSE